MNFLDGMQVLSGKNVSRQPVIVLVGLLEADIDKIEKLLDGCENIAVLGRIDVCEGFNEWYQKLRRKCQSRGTEGNKACIIYLTLNDIDIYPQIVPALKEYDANCLYLEREFNLVTYVLHNLQTYRHSPEPERPVLVPTSILNMKKLGPGLRSLRSMIWKVYKQVSVLKPRRITIDGTVAGAVRVLDAVSGISGLPARQVVMRAGAPDSECFDALVFNSAQVREYLRDSEFSDCIPSGKRLEFHCKPANGALFIHIPKAAGSSIERTLFGTRGYIGHRKALDYMNIDGDKYREYYSFTFVRNPYERVASAFLYLKKGGRNRSDRQWAEKHLAGFRLFSEFAEALADENSRREILSWMHFIPQYKFICDGKDNIVIDFMGRFERIEQDFRTVATRYGLDSRLALENRGESRDYTSLYDERTRDIIRKVYRKDFEILGYDM